MAGLQRVWAQTLRGRKGWIVLFLFCTNAITVLTLYGYQSPQPVPLEAAAQRLPPPLREVEDDQGGGLSLKEVRAAAEEPASQLAASPAPAPPADRKFERGHGLQGFVFFSAYRLLPNKFVAIGLAPLATHDLKKADVCRWRRPGGSVLANGTVEALYPAEAHQRAYEVALLVCRLRSGVRGRVGGRLEMRIGGEWAAVYEEAPGRAVPTEPGPPFRSNLTYCSSPIHGGIRAERFLEWVEYHRAAHGVDLFHMYDAGGLDDALLARLKPYVDAGAMTITDARTVGAYDTHYFGQLLLINDCAYRTHFSSRWSLFLDFDEYLYVRQEPHSVRPILASHEDKAWVTFGSLFFWTDKCTHSSNWTAEPWEVERLTFRQHDVHCRAPAKYRGGARHCLGFDGHRKYVVDPRRVSICGVHRIVRPPKGGVDTDSDDVRLAHYRGINARGVRTCTQFIHDTDPIPPTWARDFTLSRAAHAAQHLARTTPILPAPAAPGLDGPVR